VVGGRRSVAPRRETRTGKAPSGRGGTLYKTGTPFEPVLPGGAPTRFSFSPYTIDLKRSSRRAEASAFGEVAHDTLTFKQRTMRSFPPERKFVEATDPFWTNLTIKTERPDLADIQFEPRGDVEQDVAVPVLLLFAVAVDAQFNIDRASERPHHLRGYWSMFNHN
jgi:hypothetical protein